MLAEAFGAGWQEDLKKKLIVQGDGPSCGIYMSTAFTLSARNQKSAH